MFSPLYSWLSTHRHSSIYIRTVICLQRGISGTQGRGRASEGAGGGLFTSYGITVLAGTSSLCRSRSNRSPRPSRWLLNRSSLPGQRCRDEKFVQSSCSCLMSVPAPTAPLVALMNVAVRLSTTTKSKVSPVAGKLAEAVQFDFTR